jgi:hypothetical protein
MRRRLAAFARSRGALPGPRAPSNAQLGKGPAAAALLASRPLVGGAARAALARGLARECESR